jgi:hypothetical protein
LDFIIWVIPYRASFDDDDNGNDFPGSFEEELAYMELLETEDLQGTDSQEMDGQVDITSRQ